MILPHHPDQPARTTCRAIGYWRIPLDPERVATQEALIAGNGVARLPNGVTMHASPDPEVHRRHLADMRAEDRQPEPQDYVDLSWDPDERSRVAAYLRAAPIVARWMGVSRCRFCGCMNGSTCRSDGAFVWPDGFAHYLDEHGVRPPVEFVEHVLRALLQ